MKLGRSLPRILGFALLASGVFVSSANASTATCTDTCPTLTRTCGRKGPNPVPCYVRVSESSGNTTVSAQDSWNGNVCVEQGTQIRWFTSERSSTFTVTFAANPFPAGTGGTFTGDETTSKGGTANALGCYQYSASHTKNSGPPAATLDPKVIVNGVVADTSSKSVKK